jgi:hypothetical protein
MICKGMNKNPQFIGYLVAETAEAGHNSPSLVKLCESILAFGGALARPPENTQVGAATA